MVKTEPVKLDGVVQEAIPGGKFVVWCEEPGIEVICYPSGSIRMNNIRIIPGDRVAIRCDATDLTKGRITFRYKA